MTPTLALIPAKRHSEGVPEKNWKPIVGDKNCTKLAADIGHACCDSVVLSTDYPLPQVLDYGINADHYLRRPQMLPDVMIEVVKDALSRVNGPDDEIIVLLQPTSPLRTVETVKKAIAMLEEITKADSVVSVTRSYPWQWSLRIATDGMLEALEDDDAELSWRSLGVMPTRRQDCEPTYRRDGVVYAFRRRVVTTLLRDIYGLDALALHTPPDESLSIDTQADWDEAVRRLVARRSPSA